MTVALVAGAASAWISAAHADSLADAIALAYRSNPTLLGTRAQLRALNETYVQARAGWRPTATLQAAPSYSRTQTPASVFGAAGEVETNRGTAQLSVSQPIYTGGRTASAVSAAEADVLAARQTLRQRESDLILQVISAYCEVVRTMRVLEIRANDVALLQNQVDDTQARLNAGEVTRTDVVQSQVQLANARTFLIAAQGQLQSARASFTAVVGAPPGRLEPPSPLPSIPVTLDTAFDIAEQENATLSRARLAERAAAARVRQAKTAFGPSANLQLGLGYSGQVAPLETSKYQRQVQATIVLTQPLLSAGVDASNVRRARELDSSARFDVEAARRDVVQSVTQSWSSMVTSSSVSRSERAHLDLSRSYFSNTQVEYSIGQRSTLDVLVAEQILRDGEITLAGAERDAYLAGAQLLDAIGRLNVESLAGVAAYDPSKDFRRVAHAGATPWEPLIALIDGFGEPAGDPTLMGGARRPFSQTSARQAAQVGQP